MSVNIVGSWKLLAWRRIEGDKITYPLGEDVMGLLIYADDGGMSVQMLADQRPTIPTHDALGGDVNQRADAYSTCLAYFGSWKATESEITHYIEGSLFPNWSNTVQTRPFTYERGELTLRTPPVLGPNGTVVNEIVWVRQVTAPHH